ncbi:uncharacterized protein LOC126473993 isoform X1 [Schistocerca serialis cubense]|uniref:uncharacterized protein LOC126473993 isoform X1 n=1 Tax=Schistocerca serialis cubense TaxID=2023355 RepID=UPI00214ED4AE|nr:uncharacterized protein LOC126473993 isoform X1 [Schistocerca serialis cubense]XP_049957340.1 uncharacterized protein LOC126473993 isoform X1 [Schistocerca serialis cubense]
MSHFQFIPLKTPSAGCDGIIIIRSDHKELFALWQGKELMLYDVSAIDSKDTTAEVLTLKSDIVNVFQLHGSVCCLGSDASLYKLCKTDGSSSQKSYERGDEDLFESGDSADEDVRVSQFYFDPILALNNVANICPLSEGFVVVQETFGKFFIEVFSVAKCFTKTERLHSKEISYIPPKILKKNECILAAVKQKRMARDLMGILIGDMAILDIEIIFIAFKSGQVFYVPNTKTSQLPKLLYSSVHPVIDVMFLQGGTHMKLVIALEPGLLVEVRSNDKCMGQLEYVTSCLPGTIRVSCGVGSHVLAGDGSHLWCWQPEACKTSHNDSRGAGSGPQIRELAVRGVTHVCCLHTSGDALVITIHGTIYKLFPNVINESIQSDNGSGLQTDSSFFLKHQLQLLEEAEKKILCEDELIAAVGLTMRSELLKNCFTMNVNVWDVTAKNAFVFLQEMKTNLHNLEHGVKYILDICLKNSSDREFSSLIWYLLIVIKSENETVNKVIHFTDVFKKGCDINTVICSDIENPVHRITVTSTLVCKMPPAYSSEDTVLPSLFLPVDSIVLNVGYFLTPVLSLSEGIQNIASLSSGSLYKNVLPKIKGNYIECSQNCEVPPIEKEYICKIKLPTGISGDLLWQSIFKRSWHRCNADVHAWFQTSKDRVRVDQMVWVRVGQNLCKLVVNAGITAVELHSKDPLTLHAFKQFITEEMLTAGRHSPKVKIPISVVDVAQSIRMNLDIERAQPTAVNLEVLRKQWRTSVTEKLPS